MLSVMSSGKWSYESGRGVGSSEVLGYRRARRSVAFLSIIQLPQNEVVLMKLSITPALVLCQDIMSRLAISVR